MYNKLGLDQAVSESQFCCFHCFFLHGLVGAKSWYSGVGERCIQKKMYLLFGRVCGLVFFVGGVQGVYNVLDILSGWVNVSMRWYFGVRKVSLCSSWYSL